MFVNNSLQPQLNQLKILTKQPSSKAYRAFLAVVHNNTAHIAQHRFAVLPCFA